MLAFGFFGALGVALAAIDISVQRLPDQLTLPAYPDPDRAAGRRRDHRPRRGRAGAGAAGRLALAAALPVLALLRPGQLGGGDIKLAGLAGLALGWLGWPALIAGAALGFVLSARGQPALLAARRITLRSAICFGPFLLGGALLAALLSGHGA